MANEEFSLSETILAAVDGLAQVGVAYFGGNNNGGGQQFIESKSPAPELQSVNTTPQFLEGISNTTLIFGGGIAVVALYMATR
jgi:hypothetical protein